MKTFLTIWLGCSLWVSSAGVARGDIILNTDPNNSWNVYERVGVGQGNSTVFVPTLPDFSGATLLGYYADLLLAESNVFGSGFEDTIRIFSTYVLVQSPITVPVFVGGDDGHSFYLNGVQLLGHPTGGPPSLLDLDLHAGVNFLQAAVYNGPGASLLFLSTDEFSTAPLSEVPGLLMNADANFPTNVTEPTSLSLCSALAIAMWGYFRFGHRRRSLLGRATSGLNPTLYPVA